MVDSFPTQASWLKKIDPDPCPKPAFVTACSPYLNVKNKGHSNDVYYELIHAVSIYGYVESDIWQRPIQITIDKTHCPNFIGYYFISSKVFFMCNISQTR